NHDEGTTDGRHHKRTHPFTLCAAHSRARIDAAPPIGACLDEGMVADAYIEVLAGFITAPPSSYHTAAEVARRLDAAGSTRRHETEEWSGEPGGYYIVRDGAVIAWYQPPRAGPTSGFRIL